MEATMFDDSQATQWRPSVADLQDSISSTSRDHGLDAASETGTAHTIGSHKRKGSSTTVDQAIDAADTAPKRRRTTQACDLCRINHSPCDGKKPCDKCRKRKAQCTYLKQVKKRGPEKGYTLASNSQWKDVIIGWALHRFPSLVTDLKEMTHHAQPGLTIFDDPTLVQMYRSRFENEPAIREFKRRYTTSNGHDSSHHAKGAGPRRHILSGQMPPDVRMQTPNGPEYSANQEFNMDLASMADDDMKGFLPPALQQQPTGHRGTGLPHDMQESNLGLDQLGMSQQDAGNYLTFGQESSYLPQQHSYGLESFSHPQGSRINDSRDVAAHEATLRPHASNDAAPQASRNVFHHAPARIPIAGTMEYSITSPEDTYTHAPSIATHSEYEGNSTMLQDGSIIIERTASPKPEALSSMSIDGLFEELASIEDRSVSGRPHQFAENLGFTNNLNFDDLLIGDPDLP